MSAYRPGVQIIANNIAIDNIKLGAKLSMQRKNVTAKIYIRFFVTVTILV